MSNQSARSEKLGYVPEMRKSTAFIISILCVTPAILLIIRAAMPKYSLTVNSLVAIFVLYIIISTVITEISIKYESIFRILLIWIMAVLSINLDKIEAIYLPPLFPPETSINGVIVIFFIMAIDNWIQFKRKGYK